MEVRPGYKQTEVGVIPENWGDSKLQEIAEKNAPICYGIVQGGGTTDVWHRETVPPGRTGALGRDQPSDGELASVGSPIHCSHRKRDDRFFSTAATQWLGFGWLYDIYRR